MKKTKKKIKPKAEGSALSAAARIFLNEARHILRPPGGGIPAISAGVGAAAQLQCTHYQAVHGVAPNDDQSIKRLWLSDLENAVVSEKAKVVVIGVPLDTGAGIRRGAAYGPRAVREKLLEVASYKQWLKLGEVIDLGDVFVNPHLLHDEMLNNKQIAACQKAMYQEAGPALKKKLPVSALSQLEYVLQLITKAAPHLKIFIIGGDHSVAWPVSKIVAAQFKGELGIVQPDAHTDILQTRLGVNYCYGTWSFHANELLKASAPRGKPKDGRLVQLGIRQSGRGKEYWEKTTGVKQFWAHEINARKPKDVILDIITHLKSRGVKSIYFSNDIDGTDASEAPATGTPAELGLKSSFVLEVIEKLSSEFELVAADIVEVAPDLADAAGQKATTELAAAYSVACLKGMLKGAQ